MSMAEVATKALDQQAQVEAKVRDAAFVLRSEILKASRKPLPSKLTMKDITDGEIESPELLVFFLKCLISGPTLKKTRTFTEKKKNRLSSIASDVVYSVMGGRFRPAKHMELGLVVKTIAGSRKLLEILNRLGHCVSYNVVEELETELTFTASESSRLLPDGLKPVPGLHTGVAFDNFDCFVETLNGRDTLHDTVGIVYQDVPIVEERPIAHHTSGNPQRQQPLVIL